MPKVPNQVREFAAVAEREDLHGLPFQHVAICDRRAWFHLQRIDYAHLDERMQKGLALNDAYRPRDASVEGLFGLSPDRIDWKNRIVVEAKGGAGAKEAVSMQTAFYAIMLWARTGQPWRAQNDIIPAKRRRDVEVDLDVVQSMLDIANKLVGIKKRPSPPDPK